jgi:hypothetical protein
VRGWRVVQVGSIRDDDILILCVICVHNHDTGLLVQEGPKIILQLLIHTTGRHFGKECTNLEIKLRIFNDFGKERPSFPCRGKPTFYRMLRK